jgi:predicted alpha/beta-hydrolase family hydrolase
MPATEIAIPIDHPELESVTGIARDPDPGARERERAVLLAHGAGAGPASPFMTAIAEGLAARGFAVLSFHYPYMELRARDGKQRAPDRAPLLEATHAAAARALERHFAPRARPLYAGKSLGGRMATHLAAKGADCAGLVLLGFPLHAPGRQASPRSEHFRAMVQPALFLQGTRDALCDLELLRRALSTYGGAATLEVIEGADHGFSVPKRSGRTDEQVWEELLERIDAWEQGAFPRGS